MKKHAVCIAIALCALVAPSARATSAVFRGSIVAARGRVTVWVSRQSFSSSARLAMAFYENGHALNLTDGGCNGWVYGRGVMLRVDTCPAHIRIEATSLRGSAVRVYFSYRNVAPGR